MSQSGKPGATVMRFIVPRSMEGERDLVLKVTKPKQSNRGRRMRVATAKLLALSLSTQTSSPCFTSQVVLQLRPERQMLRPSWCDEASEGGAD